MTSPLEQAVLAGDPGALEALLPAASDEDTGKAFLLAVACGNEPFALTILHHEHGTMPPELAGEALRDASAHHETALLARILEEYRGVLPPEALLDALNLAIEGHFSDILDLLQKEQAFADIINTDTQQHPHPIISAILQGSEWMLEKLLGFPKIAVEPHHIALAEQYRQQELAQRLKLQLTFEQFRSLDHTIGLIQHEKTQGIVGPYMRLEEERRKRLARQMGRGL